MFIGRHTGFCYKYHHESQESYIAQQLGLNARQINSERSLYNIVTTREHENSFYNLNWQNDSKEYNCLINIQCFQPQYWWPQTTELLSNTDKKRWWQSVQEGSLVKALEQIPLKTTPV
ncbi:hypothetical protein EB796_002738 [Bugula neritina]|uniref:Uncharacterized protein n=1 Tax=Bugula neritina TaxID=10212 RepID=A0A7J7KLH0_BUGNE|nr:hypothetical protein EB796_002738 [Bugula neritina]